MTPRFSPTPTIAAAGTFAAFALLIACSGRGTIAPMPQGQGIEARGHIGAPIDALKLRTKTPIQHVFIIIQENRSFDNLFNGYPGANTVPQGLAIQMGASGTPIPGASPTTVPLQPQPLEELWDPSHTLGSWLTDWNNGAMDGFSNEGIACYTAKCVIPPANTYPTYSYVPQSETGPYWAMAQQYVLADNMFSSNADASFVAHQYLIAGWADHAADYPLEGSSWGCDNPVKTETVTKTRAYGPKESACFNYKTIASEMDHKKFGWRYYTVAGLRRADRILLVGVRCDQCGPQRTRVDDGARESPDPDRKNC